MFLDEKPLVVSSNEESLSTPEEQPVSGLHGNTKKIGVEKTVVRTDVGRDTALENLPGKKSWPSLEESEPREEEHEQNQPNSQNERH